jgi:hypothetical protein
VNSSFPPLPQNKLGSVRRFFYYLFRLLALVATVLFGTSILFIVIDTFFWLFGVPAPDRKMFILDYNYQSLLIHLFGTMSVLWLIYHIIRDDIEMIFWFMAMLVTAVVLQMFH